MSERELIALLRVKATEMGWRLFRNVTAMAWAGKTVNRTPRSVTIADPYPIHAGLCVGSSDLIGFTDTGRFVAVEVKTAKGITTKEQQAFLQTVIRAGGIGIVARSVDDLTNVEK